MEASSGSAFLASCIMMDRLGPSIFCLPILNGETKGPVPFRTLLVVMGFIPTVFLSTWIGLLAYFQFITWGSLGTPAVLRIAPVMISLWKTVRTSCKSPLLVVTPSVVVLLTGGMTPWMIAGVSMLVNHLCGEFLLVVSVSVIFLSFPSQVWVATNESIFWSLLAPSSS